MIGREFICHNQVTVFQGFAIYDDCDGDGFFWRHGGYFETVEECREDIRRWNVEELQHEIRRGL